MEVSIAQLTEDKDTVTLILVKPIVVQDERMAMDTKKKYAALFPNTIIVLMAQGTRTAVSFWGTKEGLRIVKKTPVPKIPWKRYSISGSALTEV